MEKPASIQKLSLSSFSFSERLRCLSRLVAVIWARGSVSERRFPTYHSLATAGCALAILRWNG